MMDEKEFMRLADACMAKAAKWLEGLDPDQVDYTTGDGMVTIEFADGARYVLSRQQAVKQIWLAADAAGFHYRWDDSSANWQDEKDHHELFARLAELIAGRLGQSVSPA
jgi:iron-sulfur cluster assembly protein CyaY